MACLSTILTQKCRISFALQQTRPLFHWINLQFNVLDENRRDQFGSDRTCAEWILRNGGSVKFCNAIKSTDNYNELPREGTALHLEEVDATSTSVMHAGFIHFKGCEHIKKVVFHQCHLLEDKALPDLKYLQNSLEFLQLTNCGNITDKGLLELKVLGKLKQLSLGDLPYVKDKTKTVETLQSALPKCKINFP